MKSDLQPADRPASGLPAASAPPSRPRWRLAAIGGVAAVAIAGGGITAVASASAPASRSGSALVAAVAGTSGPTVVTTRLVPSGTVSSATASEAPAPPPSRVHRPHLDGTVTSVTGSSVLLKDREGFTRTVVESSGTIYRDGLKAALTVGTKIHAEGTVASNGTSLDALVIGLDKGPGAFWPGGHGRGGRHGGPPPAGGDGKAPSAGGSSGGKDENSPPSGSAALPSTSPTTS